MTPNQIMWLVAGILIAAVVIYSIFARSRRFRSKARRVIEVGDEADEFYVPGDSNPCPGLDEVSRKSEL